MVSILSFYVFKFLRAFLSSSRPCISLQAGSLTFWLLGRIWGSLGFSGVSGGFSTFNDGPGGSGGSAGPPKRVLVRFLSLFLLFVRVAKTGRDPLVSWGSGVSASGPSIRRSLVSL